MEVPCPSGRRRPPASGRWPGGPPMVTASTTTAPSSWASRSATGLAGSGSETGPVSTGSTPTFPGIPVTSLPAPSGTQQGLSTRRAPGRCSTTSTPPEARAIRRLSVRQRIQIRNRHPCLWGRDGQFGHPDQPACLRQHQDVEAGVGGVTVGGTLITGQARRADGSPVSEARVFFVHGAGAAARHSHSHR